MPIKKMIDNSTFVDADSHETERREREVQLLINVIEPDPEYQPIFISDLATFYDVTGQDENVIQSRLEFYLKGNLPASLHTPIWQFVDMIKAQHPGWPEEWPTEN